MSAEAVTDEQEVQVDEVRVRERASKRSPCSRDPFFTPFFFRRRLTLRPKPKLLNTQPRLLMAMHHHKRRHRQQQRRLQARYGAGHYPLGSFSCGAGF